MFGNKLDKNLDTRAAFALPYQYQLHRPSWAAAGLGAGQGVSDLLGPGRSPGLDRIGPLSVFAFLARVCAQAPVLSQERIHAPHVVRSRGTANPKDEGRDRDANRLKDGG